MFGNNKDKNTIKDSKTQEGLKEFDLSADKVMQSDESAKSTEGDSALANAANAIGLDATPAMTGHGAFAVSIVPQGVAVHAGFVADGTQELMPMPAVFPNIESALAHIEDLRRLVIMRFGQIAAAQGPQLTSPDPNVLDAKAAQ